MAKRLVYDAESDGLVGTAQPTVKCLHCGDKWIPVTDQWVCPCCGHNEATVVAAAPEPREMN